MAIRIQGTVVIDDDGVFKLAAGTTAQRPAAPVTGMLFFNTDTPGFEGYDGTAWAPLASGGGGAGTDEYARTLAYLAL
jgi:hypothetical protein